MRAIWMIVAAATLGLVASCQTTGTSNLSLRDSLGPSLKEGDEPLKARLQILLDTVVTRENLPSIQVTVIDKAGRVLDLVSGTTDYSRKQRATTRTLYRFASTTKILTATVVMGLVEKGDLNLGDTIDQWYPSIPGSSAITIEMLLQQTSGLPDTFEDFTTLLTTVLQPSLVWSEGELVKRHSGHLNFVPGQSWKYSNANYILLGLIAEKVTKTSLAELFKRWISQPLALEDTFLPPHDAVPARLVAGFDRALLPFPNVHGSEVTSWASLAVGSGALVSTTHDMAVFFDALMGGRVVSPTTINRMTAFLPIRHTDRTWMGYGLGLTKIQLGNEILLGHEGLFVGFQSVVLWSSDMEATIVVVANKSKFDCGGVAEVIAEVLRSEEAAPQERSLAL